MDSILVIGGAGYIGSHVCKHLAKKKYKPIVLDNLVTGHRQSVKWGPFYHGESDCKKTLRQIFKDHKISAVMHFAAFSIVGESITNPQKYHHNNVTKTKNLLCELANQNIKHFIFSSTAAIFGNPVEIPISETHIKKPINPYGESKLKVESMLKNFDTVHGIKSISLRYFNAAGADPDTQIGEDHSPETHLIPLVLKVALNQSKQIKIFGDDYKTKDGSCIRDYIHIQDLAEAHILALQKLFNDQTSSQYNLGNGQGYSVKQVIETARKITGHKIPAQITLRRQGDPPILISSSNKAISELNWKPEFPDLETIIKTAWKWHLKSPNGFRSNSNHSHP